MMRLKNKAKKLVLQRNFRLLICILVLSVSCSEENSDTIEIKELSIYLDNNDLLAYCNSRDLSKFVLRDGPFFSLRCDISNSHLRNYNIKEGDINKILKCESNRNLFHNRVSLRDSIFSEKNFRFSIPQIDNGQIIFDIDRNNIDLGEHYTYNPIIITWKIKDHLQNITSEDFEVKCNESLKVHIVAKDKLLSEESMISFIQEEILASDIKDSITSWLESPIKYAGQCK